MLNSWPPAGLPGEPELLHDVLRRNELAGRQCYYTSRLERLWSEHTGARYAVATNSGTAALTLAFRALRPDPGDEVIVPAFTFVASALAAVHAGLVPCFCDVRPDTYGIDLAHAETLVTAHTRAIVVVHLNGVPADLGQAQRLADRHGLAVIEDACQAHGARWGDQPVGGIGFAGAFSFNRSKNLPAGEGGIVVTDSEDAFAAALAAFQFGEPSFTSPQDRTWHSTQMGWMFRPTEFTTALAAHRMRYLGEWNKARRRNHAVLTDMLGDVEDIAIQQTLDEAQPAYWRYAFTLTGDLGRQSSIREHVLTHLRAAGIAVSRWQDRVLPEHRVFTEGFGHGCPWRCHHRPAPARAEVPVARQLARSMIWLEDAIAPTNDEAQLAQVAEIIRTVLREVRDTTTRARRIGFGRPGRLSEPGSTGP